MNPMTNVDLPIPERLMNWLKHAVQIEASDIHLVPGHPPAFRVHGELVELPGQVVDTSAVFDLVNSIGSAALSAKLQSEKNLDFSFETMVGNARKRFRTNAFFTEDRIAGCLRLVPDSIPSFEWAGIPADLGRRIAGLRDGMVIVTGITGSGKTTTLAMIVNLINQQGGSRIITIEEPIEYRFPKAPNSVVTQREVGNDVLCFSDGLRSGLRQDPDIVLVGEIRDRETAQMALSAAETGHLMLTTLHTRDAKGAISRYADLFPQDVQTDIRVQLALSLKSIISQRLLPDVLPGKKRHLALEILWNCPPIASSIRQGRLESIDNYLITRRDEGMQGFDESVRQLWQAGKITRDIAEQNVRDPSSLNRL